MKHKYMISLDTELENETVEINVQCYLTESIAQHLANNGYRVYPMLSVAPNWIYDIGLGFVWEFCSDVFNFRNPFARKENTTSRPAH